MNWLRALNCSYHMPIYFEINYSLNLIFLKTSLNLKNMMKYQHRELNYQVINNLGVIDGFYHYLI